MKIFITGFQRSGTTLLRKIIHYHPHVDFMLHETRMLYKVNNKKTINKEVQKQVDKLNKRHNLNIQFDPNRTYGEKVPWRFSKNTKVINYCNKWNKIFEDQNPKIIHIVRNPISVLLSNQNKGFFKDEKTCLNHWNQSVYPTIEYINSIDNGITIVYEDLLLNHKAVLKQIFHFCELNCSNKTLDKIHNSLRKNLRHFNKIDSSRAFSYVNTYQERTHAEFLNIYKQRVNKYLIGNVIWK